MTPFEALNATVADLEHEARCDIATCGHARDWNNPRFRANPGMWGKYSW